MKKVIIILTDDSVGAEDIPEDVEVEIHDYRRVSLADPYKWQATDERGVDYVVYDLTGGHTI